MPDQDTMPEQNVQPGAPPPAWDEVADKFQKAFPTFDPDMMRRDWENARKLAVARRSLPVDADQPIERKSVPFISATRNVLDTLEYAGARKRFDAGQAEETDYGTIAKHEYQQQQDLARSKTWGGGAQELGMHLPAIAGEFAVGGALAKGATGLLGLAPTAEQAAATAALPWGARMAAGFAPRALAQSAVSTAVLPVGVPSMWANQGVQNNLEAGRDSTDLRGFAASYSLATLQLGVMQGVSSLPGNVFGGAGVGNFIARAATKGAVGIPAAMAANVTGHLAGLETGYGSLQSLLEGRYGDAGRQMAGDFVTFALFHAMHEAQEGTPAQQKAAAEAAQKQVRELIQPLQDMAKRGITPEEAFGFHDNARAVLAQELHQNPNLSRKDVMDLADTFHEGPERAFLQRWAPFFPKEAPPGPQEGPKTAPPSPPGPETDPTTAPTAPEAPTAPPGEPLTTLAGGKPVRIVERPDGSKVSMTEEEYQRHLQGQRLPLTRTTIEAEQARRQQQGQPPATAEEMTRLLIQNPEPRHFDRITGLMGEKGAGVAEQLAESRRQAAGQLPHRYELERQLQMLGMNPATVARRVEASGAKSGAEWDAWAKEKKAYQKSHEADRLQYEYARTLAIMQGGGRDISPGKVGRTRPSPPQAPPESTPEPSQPPSGPANKLSPEHLAALLDDINAEGKAPERLTEPPTEKPKEKIGQKRERLLTELKQGFETPEEITKRQLMTSKKWGIGNTAAYEEAQAKDPKPFLAITDVDKLGSMEKGQGDNVIRGKIDALKAAGLEPFHAGQDEFYVRGDSAEDLRTKLEVAREKLRQTHGADFSYGIGEKKVEADDAMRAMKDARPKTDVTSDLNEPSAESPTPGEPSRGQIGLRGEKGPQKGASEETLRALDERARAAAEKAVRLGWDQERIQGHVNRIAAAFGRSGIPGASAELTRLEQALHIGSPGEIFPGEEPAPAPAYEVPEDYVGTKAELEKALTGRGVSQDELENFRKYSAQYGSFHNVLAEFGREPNSDPETEQLIKDYDAVLTAENYGDEIPPELIGRLGMALAKKPETPSQRKARLAENIKRKRSGFKPLAEPGAMAEGGKRRPVMEQPETPDEEKARRAATVVPEPVPPTEPVPVKGASGALTDQEKYVQDQMRGGRSLRSLEKELRISYDQVRRISNSAQQKLGKTQSLSAELKEEGLLSRKVENGEDVATDELHRIDPRGVIRNARINEIAEAHDALDDLYKTFTKEKENGIAPERDAEFRTEVERLRGIIDASQGETDPTARQPSAASGETPAPQVGAEAPSGDLAPRDMFGKPIFEGGGAKQQSLFGSGNWFETGYRDAQQGKEPRRGKPTGKVDMFGQPVLGPEPKPPDPAYQLGFEAGQRDRGQGVDDAERAFKQQTASSNLAVTGPKLTPSGGIDWKAEATSAGIPFEALEAQAKDFRTADYQTVKQYNALMRETEAALKEQGITKQQITALYGKGRDYAGLKGFDVVADLFQQGLKEVAQPGEDAEATLWRLHTGRQRSQITKEQSYRDALDYLSDKKAVDDAQRQAQREGHPAPDIAEALRSGQEDAQGKLGEESAAAGERPAGEYSESDLGFPARGMGAASGGIPPGRPPGPGTPGAAGVTPPNLTPQPASSWFNKVSAFMRSFAQQQFPAVTRLNRPAAEKLAQAANAPTAARLSWDYFKGILKMGNLPMKSWSEQEKQAAGAVWLERRARQTRDYFLDQSRQESANAGRLHREAAADAQAGYQQHPKEVWQEMKSLAARRATAAMIAARNVVTLIGQPNSPLPTEADYQAGLDGMRAFWEAVRQEWTPEVEKNYRGLKGLDPADAINSPTQIEGLPLNAIALTEEQAQQPGIVRAGPPGQRGMQGLLIRRPAFMRQAGLDADAYDLNLEHMMQRTLDLGIPAARRAEFVRAALEGGILKDVSRGDPIPQGWEYLGLDPAGKIPGIDPNARYYVHPEAFDEVTQGLGIGKRFGKQVSDVVGPVMDKVYNIALMSPVEMMTHIGNHFTALFRSGMGMPIYNLKDSFANAYKVYSEEPEMMRRVMELAKMGAAFQHEARPGLLGEKLKGYDPTAYMNRFTSKLIDVMQKAVRVQLEDAFDRTAKAGLFPDTETAKRDFINSALGNYSSQANNRIAQFLKDTGLQSFATAAHTFTVQGVKSLWGGAVNAPATSYQAQAQLRATAILKMLPFLAIGPVVNYLRWGQAFPQNVPAFAVKTREEDDKDHYVDPVAFTGLRRGARATGVNSLVEGMLHGKTGGQMLDQGGKEAFESGEHLFEGPPVRFLHTLRTGENAVGMKVAAKAPKGESQLARNALAAAEGVNPVIAAATANPKKPRTWWEVVMQNLGPFGEKTREKKVGAR